MGRRQFLQGIAALGSTYLGSSLGSNLGLGEKVVWAAEQYQKTFVKNTRRKLALLIGINQYEAKGDWLPLRGCLTDVEMQRELLIHRFGFLPTDILTLTDQQASRAAIAQAFSEHLISQALPDDLVLVHFSGHGSQIGNQKTLLPADSVLPLVDLPALDFSLETISLWLRAIASQNLTCVIDAGYVNPGAAIVGNFRIRSRPSRADLQFCAAELELKQNLALQFGIQDQSAFFTPKSILQVSDRLCADLICRDFSCGAFSYALTQQLWQIIKPSSFKLILPTILSTLEQKAFAPIEKLASALVDQQLPIANLTAADGVILSLSESGKTAEIWLGGLSVDTLSSLGVGSILGQNQTRLQVRSLDRLTAKAELLDGAKPGVVGQLLREQIRVLPQDLGLVIALDLGLAKIERVEAIAAISDIPHSTGVNAAEEYADCIFGTESNSYGLFTVGRSPILGSFGAISESVGAAIRRLRPKLEGLLAAKLIEFTNNQFSSGLALRVQLVAKRGIELIPIASIEQSTRLVDQIVEKDPVITPVIDPINSLVVGDRLTCYLENLTQVPLYIQIFSFDSRGKMITPSFAIAPYINDGILLPQQTLIIPQPDAAIAWTVSAPRGLVNLQVIASRFPLIHSTELREQYARQATSPTSMIAVPNPLAVAQALLSDLAQSQEPSESSEQSTWRLNLNDWATLSLSYHVV